MIKRLVADKLPLFLLALAGVGFLSLFSIYRATVFQQFSDQSWSFIHGRLDIHPSQEMDAVIVNGKLYWPEGPFPSVVLMPFQLLFGPSFNQSSLQPFLIIVIGFLLYYLARQKKFRPLNAIFLTSVYLLGSTAVGVLVSPAVWYFGQVVTMVLLLGVLYEWETRQRFWLLGFLLSGLWATRPPSGFVIFPIIVLSVLQWRRQRPAWTNVAGLVGPLFVTAGLLLWFNYARFGNILDNGYWANQVGTPLVSLRELGVFSWRHWPTNIYWYFLASYQTVTNGTANLVFPFVTYSLWGLSFFLVAPFFLYARRSLGFRDVESRLLWATVALTLLFDMTYYNTGYSQFGPRFTIDFLPILYLLLLTSFQPPELTRSQKMIIVLSSLANIYVLFSRQFLVL